MRPLHSVRNFGKEIYRTYVVDRPTHFAASLAYYSLFSLVPTVYIALLFAGIFVENEAARASMFAGVENALGIDAARLLFEALEGISRDPSSGTIIDRLVSAFAMLFGASLVFFKLQYALNTIWKIPPATEGQTKTYILNHLLAFAIVFGVGVLVVVITLMSTLLSFLDSLFQIQLLTPLLTIGANLIIETAAITLVFKLLPDARISWKDAVIGAGVTAVLLLAGTKLLGWYLAKGSVGSAFEAAGTVAILLIAIYFLAQFFIFGTVFTRVFAEFYGSGIHPRKAVASRSP